MGFLYKSNLKEVEAADEFVRQLTKDVQLHWPVIAESLNMVIKTDKSLEYDKVATFEFLIALAFVQIQILPNLFPKEQAERIRWLVLRLLSSPEVGYQLSKFRKYQDLWDKSLKKGNPPFAEIASILLDIFEHQNSVRLEGASFRDPMTIRAVSELVLTYWGGWWKAVSKNHKLVS